MHLPIGRKPGLQIWRVQADAKSYFGGRMTYVDFL